MGDDLDDVLPEALRDDDLDRFDDDAEELLLLLLMGSVRRRTMPDTTRLTG